MSLKLYYDLLSQPSRALFIFLRTTKIPFEGKTVNLGAGEHLRDEFAKVNPVKKVPVIDHNGFKLTESVAILRYLCREFKVDDHWYPKDSKEQAKVDEYLEWQHLNTRLHCAEYFWIKCLTPMLKGKPPNEQKLAQAKERMITTLDNIENIWLRDRPYLTGQKISIADILGICELEQPKMAGFDPYEGRAKLTAWMKRVIQETNPHHDEAHKYIGRMAKTFAENELKIRSSL